MVQPQVDVDERVVFFGDVEAAYTAAGAASHIFEMALRSRERQAALEVAEMASTMVAAVYAEPWHGDSVWLLLLAGEMGRAADELLDELVDGGDQ